MDCIYREFPLRSKTAWDGIVKFVQNNAKACLERGRPLRVIITDDEKRRNNEQNKRLWKAVYEPIADQAWVAGKQYSKDVWHEHFANLFLPKREVITPFGEVVTRRASTSELTVSEFSEYMQNVEAWAAQNLGVIFE